MDRSAAIEIIMNARAKPFERSINDCFTLALDVIEALTGQPCPERKYVGTYDSLAMARKQLYDSGFKTLGAWLASRFEQIAPAEALLGDLGVPRGSRAKETIFVFDGQYWSTMHPDGGMERVTIHMIDRAFRVA